MLIPDASSAGAQDTAPAPLSLASPKPRLLPYQSPANWRLQCSRHCSCSTVSMNPSPKHMLHQSPAIWRRQRSKHCSFSTVYMNPERDNDTRFLTKFFFAHYFTSGTLIRGTNRFFSYKFEFVEKIDFLGDSPV